MEREDKQAQHPAGFEPMTSLLQDVHSIAVLQLLPYLTKHVVRSFSEVGITCLICKIVINT